jgi:hypothetical protein
MGANVIVPGITSTRVRLQYKLYSHKICPDENAAGRFDVCGASRVMSFNRTIGADCGHVIGRQRPEG